MAPDDETPAEVVDRNAQGPAEVQEGSTRVKARDLAELRQWEKDRAGQNALRSGGSGLYRRRMIPPGTADA